MLIIYHVVFLHTDQHNHEPVIFVAHGAKPGNNSAWILDYTNSTTWEEGTNIKNIINHKEPVNLLQICSLS